MRQLQYHRPLGLAIGFVADRVFGDPQRWHPVAGFGQLATRLENASYADSRRRGLAFTACLLGGSLLAGVAAERVTSPVLRTSLTAFATWAVLGGTSLEREASTVFRLLDAGELPAARSQLTRLVGRDTQSLTESEIARAVVESVAENTADAEVGPLFWGMVAGVPGLVGYRAANTLDAMVGHHNPRYESFGWASARLDDLLNLPVARWSAVLAMLTNPQRAWRAWTTWRRDAAGHPSPNAGVIEAAFAGILGVQLGGTNTYYGNRVEHRAVLGDGRACQPGDILRANSVARRIGIAAVACAVVVAARPWPR